MILERKDMKVGDRVRLKASRICKDEPIVIVDVFEIAFYKIRSRRYQIKYLNVYSSDGDKLATSWVDGGDINLDIEYYREKKLNELGI